MVITHYYTQNSKPFQSITDLPTSLRQNLCKLFTPNTNRAFIRFKDYDTYINNRIKTEEWLYYEFIKIGGIPLVYHPLYFVLGESTYLKNCFGKNTLAMQLDITHIPATDISFTLRDSVQLYLSAVEPHDIYNIERLNRWINLHFSSMPQLENYMNQRHIYVEAQLWNPHWIIDSYPLL